MNYDHEQDIMYNSILNNSRFWTICERYLRMRISNVSYQAYCHRARHNQEHSLDIKKKYPYLESYGMFITVEYDNYFFHNEYSVSPPEPPEIIPYHITIRISPIPKKSVTTLLVKKTDGSADTILTYTTPSCGNAEIIIECVHLPSECIDLSLLVDQLKSLVDPSWFCPIPHESQHIEHKPENNMTCDWGIHGTCAEYK